MTNWKYGERLFKQTMEDRGYTVVDVAKNPEYYEKDVDVILTSSTSGLTKSFEVKWDGKINSTHNLFLEIENTNGKTWGKDGWWKHIQADYLAYGDAKAQYYYMFDVQQLKERVKQLPQKKRSADGGKSVGLVVSLDDVKDLYVMLRNWTK